LSPVLVGRSNELAVLRGLLERVAQGLSGSLVLRGEAGIGKTALLDEAIETAREAGMRTVRLTGVESETQLGYAGLHLFLLQFADHIETLPGPQRKALQSTFGVVEAAQTNRFLVALGVLTLLADVASDAPVVCVVDDAQWLDPESEAVLAFVARRLYAERIVLVFAVREPSERSPLLIGVPDLSIGALDDSDASALLLSSSPGRLSSVVGARIIAETGGNPLALVELARQLSPAQLTGSAPLPEPLLPVGDSVQEAFRRRVNELTPEARLMLTVAAAEPNGSQALLWRTAERLGVDPEAAASVDLSDLVEFSPRVAFRHSLVRSAAYHATPLPERRLIHKALAAETDAVEEPDRIAWHLGLAAGGPDEGVAAQLEQAAGRARDRGGYAATVTFLSRAAELTVDEPTRGRRLLAAAEAALSAGQPQWAGALLDEAMPRLGDPLTHAQASRLQGAILFNGGKVAEATTVLLEAVRAFAPIDARTAREALLEAFEAGQYAGWSPRQERMAEIARAAQALPAMFDSEASATDLLLAGSAARVALGYPAAVPLLRRAIATLDADDLEPGEGLRRLAMGCVVAGELYDDRAHRALALRCVRLARNNGAVMVLSVALTDLAAMAHVSAGDFDAAHASHVEGREILAATGPGVSGSAGVVKLYELAWRGAEDDARESAAAIAKEASDAGRGLQGHFAQYCMTILELGLGNYEAALRHALYVHEQDSLFIGTQVLPELVEAAVRAGKRERAEQALEQLSERALASGTSLAMGLLARSRALLADDAEADTLYQDAILQLRASTAAPQLARAHLLYGEWLRRQRRKSDARDQLRVAGEMFDSMGAAAFAERARIELLAAGERVLRARPRPSDLTSQEAHIARLVSEGNTNRDIAAQLFLSPATVEYHLRKVFRKLGVTSRTQLAVAMISDSS
jgi:DNA-binding CsgD family transcriptional regulator